MKLVVAVIQPTKLRAVKEALAEVGVERITICDSQEYAQRPDRVPIFRGLEISTDVLRKSTLEIAVNDDFLERTIETICQVARTGARGSDGDGKIFVLPLAQAIDLKNGSRSKGAI
ncbi:MAG TPA: P-II family nitrogen regulator [Pirellulaceae bacterium]|nr:P-II family nitrogen regulator [Pirellulaceae bacterium]HMO91633.1 P-II family nitrogen regulator [Pirellulaceae bacterium]HMP68330.1 P-II family nitrogen regulator [Pirellulaceae bacterium]